MARPKKQPHEKRTEALHADVTLAEKERARQLVVASGLSEAEFIRRAVFGASIPSPAPRRIDASVLTELNKLGLQASGVFNNANQIARNRNSGRQERLAWEQVADEASVTLAEIRGLMGKVADAYGA